MGRVSNLVDHICTARLSKLEESTKMLNQFMATILSDIGPGRPVHRSSARRIQSSRPAGGQSFSLASIQSSHPAGGRVSHSALLLGPPDASCSSLYLGCR